MAKVECPECEGSGKEYCLTCGGSGTCHECGQSCPECYGLASYDCCDCNGSGEVEDDA